MSAAYVYILSNRTHRLYVGTTNDLARRLREHREKKRESFTARYTYKRLVYFEVLSSVEAAFERERQIKGWTRAKKVALIQSVNPNWHDVTPDWTELLCLR